MNKNIVHELYWQHRNASSTSMIERFIITTNDTICSWFNVENPLVVIAHLDFFRCIFLWVKVYFDHHWNNRERGEYWERIEVHKRETYLPSYHTI